MWMVQMPTSLLLALTLASAARADGGDEGAPEDTAEPEETAALPMDLDAAVETNALSQAQLDWLKPSPRNLPQNPYWQTDFTAYTLEWGEVQVGLGSIYAGILPRVQVGTSPALNLIGLYNGYAKVNIIRLGPVALAGQAQHYSYPVGELKGSLTGVGGTMSVRVLAPWTVHLTGQYATIGVHGLPDTSAISPLVENLTGADLDAWREAAVEQGITVALDAEAITAKLATDFRFNRRDSLIVQGQAMIWGSLTSQTTGEVDIPPILGLDKALSMDEQGFIPLGNSYTASASWQWSWKRSYLRVGAGVSSVKGAWLLQSTEFATRFGGKSRRLEAKMRKGWRHNRRDLRRGEESAVAQGESSETASPEASAEP